MTFKEQDKEITIQGCGGSETTLVGVLHNADKPYSTRYIEKFGYYNNEHSFDPKINKKIRENSEKKILSKIYKKYPELKNEKQKEFLCS